MPSRPPKRKRPSSPPHLKPTASTTPTPPTPPPPLPAHHTTFTQWSLTRGLTVTSVTPTPLPARGIGLTTTAPIKSSSRILIIPPTAIFRPKPRLLRRPNLSPTVSPQAHLALSVLLAFGPADSPYKVWRDTWPSREDMDATMPMCWRPEEQALLPPAAGRALERQVGDFERDWGVVRGVCEGEGWGWAEFRYFWLVVNSRSFHWKPAGSGGEKRRREKGMMVLCPFVDYINHGPTGSGCVVTQGEEGYEVVAERDYAPGEEILATYGPHPPATLLIHYGFVPPTSHPPSFSPDDALPLDALLLPAIPAAIHPHLQSLGYLGGYTLHPATNALCFRTQVAVRAGLLALTSNEWEYFALNGEDLGGDREGEVREAVGALLRGWRGEVVGRVRECEVKVGEGGERVGVYGVLGEAWRGVLAAVERFLGEGEG